MYSPSWWFLDIPLWPDTVLYSIIWGVIIGWAIRLRHIANLPHGFVANDEDDVEESYEDFNF